MRRILTYTLCLLVFASCDAKRSTMEKELINNLTCPATYQYVSFDKVKTITLGDQYYNEISLCEEQIQRTKEELEFARSMKDELAELNEELAKQKAKLEFLRSSQQVNEQYRHKVILTVYKLTYDAQNTNGALVRDYCYATFNNDGQMTSISYDSNSGLHQVIQDIAIPNYYNY